MRHTCLFGSRNHSWLGLLRVLGRHMEFRGAPLCNGLRDSSLQGKQHNRLAQTDFEGGVWVSGRHSLSRGKRPDQEDACSWHKLAHKYPTDAQPSLGSRYAERSKWARPLRRWRTKFESRFYFLPRGSSWRPDIWVQERRKRKWKHQLCECREFVLSWGCTLEGAKYKSWRESDVQWLLRSHWRLHDVPHRRRGDGYRNWLRLPTAARYSEYQQRRR